MKIEKYKYLGNGKYKIFIDSCDYVFYEDVILKYNILAKNDVSKVELEKYLSFNKRYDAYYKALSYINIKLRTKSEIISYLKKNSFSDSDIDYAISLLNDNNYLDEEVYARAFISDCINLKNVGPIKIKNDLIRLGVNNDVIDRELLFFNDEKQNDKVCKFIEKSIRNNKSKSSYVLKNKIKASLINLGYDVSRIDSFLSEYDFDDRDIYNKQYEIIKNKLSKKYDGKELELKIKEQLYRKGFRI